MPEIIVKVHDAWIKKPLYGVSVSIDGKTTSTDPRGVARLIVPPGKYILKIRSPDYEPITMIIQVGEKDIEIPVHLRKVHL